MQLHYLLVEAYDILAWTRNALVNWMLYLYGYWVCHKSFLIHLGESLLFFKTVGTAWATSLLQEPWSQRSSWLVSTPSFKQPYTRRLERFSSQNHCALMNDWFYVQSWTCLKKVERTNSPCSKAYLWSTLWFMFASQHEVPVFTIPSTVLYVLFQTIWFLIAGTFWNFTPLFSFEWSRNQSIAFMERTKPDSTIQPYQVLGDRT